MVVLVIHAASYSTEGMYCNQVVTRRNMPGEHKWRIKIRLETDTEIREEVIEPDAKVPIGYLKHVVNQCLASVCATPEMIRRARMDFYVLPRAVRASKEGIRRTRPAGGVLCQTTPAASDRQSSTSPTGALAPINQEAT